MRKKIELAVKILVGLSFLVPLVLISSRFIFPFIVPKILIFRTLVLLMLGGYIILLASNWETYKIQITPITWAIGLFFLSFTISTFVGKDWYHSFWDNHERMLGLFTLVHYGLYYLVATTVIREWRDWRWLMRAFLFAGTICMFIGLLQEFNPTLLLNSSGSRVASTLGNPIYVGGYGLFLSFLGWLLYMKEEKKWWKVYGIVGGLWGVAGIFMSGTRGSLLGFIAGIVVLCICYAFGQKGHATARRSIIIVLSALVILSGFIYVFRHTNFVQNLPTIGSLVNTSLTGGDASTRLMAWGVAFDAWKEHMIFGWGPNNFFYAFNKYYRPEFLEHGWAETWFDNAHNIIMNTLAVQGAFGLITYLGMFTTVILILWRRHREGKVDVQIASIGTAFLIAHLTQNVFVFEDPTSYLYFFFFLAFLDRAVVGFGPKAEEKAVGEQSISLGFSAFVMLLIGISIFATDVNPARANMSTLELLRSLYTGVDPVGAFNATMAIPSPHVDDIRNDFARTVFSVLPQYVQSNRQADAKQLLNLAYDELRKNRALHPDDIRVHLQQAQLAEQGAVYLQQPALMLDAEQALIDALTKSPKRQQLQYTLASIEYELGHNDQAIALLKQSIDNDPKIGEGWWRLAYLYQSLHQLPQAVDVVRRARLSGAGFDDNALKIMNDILPLATPGTKK